MFFQKVMMHLAKHSDKDRVHLLRETGYSGQKINLPYVGIPSSAHLPHCRHTVGTHSAWPDSRHPPAPVVRCRSFGSRSGRHQTSPLRRPRLLVRPRLSHRRRRHRVRRRTRLTPFRRTLQGRHVGSLWVGIQASQAQPQAAAEVPRQGHQDQRQEGQARVEAVLKTGEKMASLETPSPKMGCETNCWIFFIPSFISLF